MRRTLAESCLWSSVVTGWRAGALTVAGQWRIFTAFPNILAIAVVNCSAKEQRRCHGIDFYDMNIYSRDAGSASKDEHTRHSGARVEGLRWCGLFSKVPRRDTPRHELTTIAALKQSVVLTQ